jgi:hypothetical protein
MRECAGWMRKCGEAGRELEREGGAIYAGEVGLSEESDGEGFKLDSHVRAHARDLPCEHARGMWSSCGIETKPLWHRN